MNSGELIIEPFQSAHLEMLRAQGVQPWQQSELDGAPVGFADRMIAVGEAATARIGDKILMCGGVIAEGPIGTLWALVGANAGQYMVPLHRLIRRWLDTVPLRRIEVSVEEGFAEGVRWVELLGFEYEGPMRCYGEQGQTHFRYARVRPDLVHAARSH